MLNEKTFLINNAYWEYYFGWLIRTSLEPYSIFLGNCWWNYDHLYAAYCRDHKIDYFITVCFFQIFLLSALFQFIILVPFLLRSFFLFSKIWWVLWSSSKYFLLNIIFLITVIFILSKYVYSDQHLHLTPSLMSSSSILQSPIGNIVTMSCHDWGTPEMTGGKHSFIRSSL